MMRVPARWCASLLFALVLGWSTLFLVLAATPAVAQPAKPDQAKLDQAREHMSAGSLLYNDPSGPPGIKCEEALAEFSKAYDLSGSWKALRAMSICEQKLERDGNALAHYEQVLQLGAAQLTPDEKAQIEGDIRTLRTSIAQVRITTNQPSARLVATRQPSQGLAVTNRYPVASDGVTLGLHPGQYTFTASADGFPDVAWQAEIPNGSHLEHHFDFVIKPDDKGVARPPGVEMERPVPITVWIFTGVTGACAITSATFMGLSKGAKDDFDEKNDGSGTTSQADLEDLRSDVITKNIVADVMLGATAASFAVTLVFYFTRPEVPREQGKEAAWMLLPVVGPETAGATFMSSF
jgi:hypothetical protein